MEPKTLKEEVLCLNGDETAVKDVKENMFRKMWNNMTLEPMWFGISSAMMIGLIAFKNYYLQRACMVDLGYPEDVCLNKTDNANFSQIEKESQEIIAAVYVSSGFVGNTFTMIVVLFLGPWSDASGKRRPLIVYPILMMLVGSFNMLVMQALPDLSVKWVIYLHAIPIAMGGNFSLLTIACFSYLGDVCTKTGRCLTTVIGSNNGCFVLFMIFGTIMGPVVYRTLGFTALFAICFTLELSAFLYAYFTVRDVIEPEKVIPKIYDLRLPIKAVKCVFKKREGTKRRVIVLIILVTCCNTILHDNDSANSYLYLRKNFSWTEVEYSVLLTIKSFIYMIGTFLIVTIFKRRMNIRDKFIGIMGGASVAISHAAFMLSRSGNQVYAARLFSIFGSGIMLAERPILLKQIQANEQGKISCITSIIDNCVGLAITPLSHYVYLLTLETFPVCYMFISLIAGIMQTILYVLIDDPKIVDKNNDTDEAVELKKDEGPTKEC